MMLGTQNHRRRDHQQKNKNKKKPNGLERLNYFTNPTGRNNDYSNKALESNNSSFSLNTLQENAEKFVKHVKSYRITRVEEV